jgi:acyl-coenzyme A thioesterase PaaI-like protein
MALADCAGAACAFLDLPDRASGTTTIEPRTNFLRAVSEGTAIATASVARGFGHSPASRRRTASLRGVFL